MHRDPDDTIIPQALDTIPSPPPSGCTQREMLENDAFCVIQTEPTSVDWDGFASDALDESS